MVNGISRGSVPLTGVSPHETAPRARDTVASGGSASLPDVEAVIARYIEGVRAESRTARSVSMILDELRAAEQRRAIRLGMRRARSLCASAVFRGILGLASAAATAVSSVSSVSVARVAAASSKGCDAASVIFDVAGRRADRLDVDRAAASATSDEQERYGRLASSHCALVEESRRRALDVLERCSATMDSARRAAISGR